MKNESGITPLDVKVLVRPDPVEEVTKGGIIFTDAAKDKAKYAGTKATLVAAGPNAFKDWGEGSAPLIGSRVLYAQYSGARQKGLDDDDYVVMNDEDLICTIEGAQ